MGVKEGISTVSVTVEVGVGVKEGISTVSVTVEVGVGVKVASVGVGVSVTTTRQLLGGEDRVTEWLPGRVSVQVSSTECAPEVDLATLTVLLAEIVPLPAA